MRMTAFPKRRIRLKKAAYGRLKRRIHEIDGWRCVNPHCCWPVPPEALQVHHHTTRGAGGSDTIENGYTFCPHCHRAIQEHRLVLDWEEIDAIRKSHSGGG